MSTKTIEVIPLEPHAIQRRPRWLLPAAFLVIYAAAGAVLLAAVNSADTAPTTWNARPLPGFTLFGHGTAISMRIKVTNTGTSRDGFVQCDVWGFSNLGHVASGISELPAELAPGRSAVVPVTLGADGFPASAVAGVTGFTAACYDE